jgi:Flp pilus assembly protein TadG
MTAVPLKKVRFLARFARARRGATAVEFAIVAAPFLALLMGIIDLALAYTASITLDNAVQAAAREIRTGQTTSPTGATAQETSRLAFRDKVCANMGFMSSDCASKLTVDVRTVTQFSDIALSSPISNGVFNPGSLQFNTGGASQIVLVRAYYQWDLYAPMMNTAMVKLPGKTLLTSVTTFRNEPYNL